MTHSLWLVNYFEFTLSKCLKEKRLGMVEKRAGLWEGGGKGRAMMGVELWKLCLPHILSSWHFHSMDGTGKIIVVFNCLFKPSSANPFSALSGQNWHLLRVVFSISVWKYVLFMCNLPYEVDWFWHVWNRMRMSISLLFKRCGNPVFLYCDTFLYQLLTYLGGCNVALRNRASRTTLLQSWRLSVSSISLGSLQKRGIGRCWEVRPIGVRLGIFLTILLLRGGVVIPLPISF